MVVSARGRLGFDFRNRMIDDLKFGLVRQLQDRHPNVLSAARTEIDKLVGFPKNVVVKW